MKKIISLLLVLATLMGLAACGAKSEAPVVVPTDPSVTTQEVTDPQTNEEVTESETAEETTEEATEAGIVVDTKILKEADEKMLNTYSAIAVNDAAPFVDADGNAVADVYVNTAGADALIQWLMTEEAL